MQLASPSLCEQRAAGEPIRAHQLAEQIRKKFDLEVERVRSGGRVVRCFLPIRFYFPARKGGTKLPGEDTTATRRLPSLRIRRIDCRSRFEHVRDRRYDEP